MTSRKKAGSEECASNFAALSASPSELGDRAMILRMYKKMVEIRQCEEQLNAAFAKNLYPGFIHSYMGQEACAVGICAALRDDDYIVSTHRPRGHYLAKGMALKPMICEMFGKANGICGGRGGEMHAADPTIGILGGNGIVGGGLPYATGAAYSALLEGSDRLCAVFFGEGASNQGAFHEALNLSASWDLPMIFVCENNLYAEMTPFCETSRQTNVAERAAGYGVNGQIVDGNDVLLVFAAAREAAERARGGQGPTLLELKTYRYGGHFEGDPCRYRAREEENEWKARDPLIRLRALICERGIESEEQLSGWEEDIRRLVTDAIEWALNSPEPDPRTALSYVYAS